MRVVFNIRTIVHHHPSMENETQSPQQPAKAQASGTAPVEAVSTRTDPVSEPGKATTELVEPERGDGESVGTEDCGEAQGDKGKSPTSTASRLADTVAFPQHPIPTRSHSPELAPAPSLDTHVAGPHSASCWELDRRTLAIMHKPGRCPDEVCDAFQNHGKSDREIRDPSYVAVESERAAYIAANARVLLGAEYDNLVQDEVERERVRIKTELSTKCEAAEQRAREYEEQMLREVSVYSTTAVHRGKELQKITGKLEDLEKALRKAENVRDDAVKQEAAVRRELNAMQLLNSSNAKVIGELQGRVTSLETERDHLREENTRLEAESGQTNHNDTDNEDWADDDRVSESSSVKARQARNKQVKEVFRAGAQLEKDRRAEQAHQGVRAVDSNQPMAVDITPVKGIVESGDKRKRPGSPNLDSMPINPDIDWERTSLVSALDGYNVLEAIRMFDSQSARNCVENIMNSRGLQGRLLNPANNFVRQHWPLVHDEGKYPERPYNPPSRYEKKAKMTRPLQPSTAPVFYPPPPTPYPRRQMGYGQNVQQPRYGQAFNQPSFGSAPHREPIPQGRGFPPPRGGFINPPYSRVPFPHVPQAPAGSAVPSYSRTPRLNPQLNKPGLERPPADWVQWWSETNQPLPIGIRISSTEGLANLDDVEIHLKVKRIAPDAALFRSGGKEGRDMWRSWVDQIVDIAMKIGSIPGLLRLLWEKLELGNDMYLGNGYVQSYDPSETLSREGMARYLRMAISDDDVHRFETWGLVRRNAKSDRAQGDHGDWPEDLLYSNAAAQTIRGELLRRNRIDNRPVRGTLIGQFGNQPIREDGSSRSSSSSRPSN